MVFKPQNLELEGLTPISTTKYKCMSHNNNRCNNGDKTAKEGLVENVDLQDSKIEDSQFGQVLAHYRNLIEESQLSAAQSDLLLEIIYTRFRTSLLQNSFNNTDTKKSKQIPKSPIQLRFPETQEFIRSASDTSCFFLQRTSSQFEDCDTSDSALNTAFLSDRSSIRNRNSCDFSSSKDFSNILNATEIYSSHDVISNSISNTRSSGLFGTTKYVDNDESEMSRSLNSISTPSSSSDETWTTCQMSTISCSSTEIEATDSSLSSSLNLNTTAILIQNEKLKDIIRKYLGSSVSDSVSLEH